MVHLIDHQQCPMTPDLREMQIRCSGDTLVGGDVAGQATGGIGRIVGRANGKAMTQGCPPDGIGKCLLRLQTEAVARHDPADALDHACLDQTGGGDDGKQRLAASGGDGCEDVECVGRARGDRLDYGGELPLMGAEGRS